MDSSFIVDAVEGLGKCWHIKWSFIVVAVERVHKCCRTKLSVYVVILCGLLPLSPQARAGSLAIEDMDGGTFTISNGGVFGSMFGTPIINPPQSAILGMHAIFNRPVAVGGKVITLFVLCLFQGVYCLGILGEVSKNWDLGVVFPALESLGESGIFGQGLGQSGNFMIMVNKSAEKGIQKQEKDLEPKWWIVRKIQKCFLTWNLSGMWLNPKKEEEKKQTLRLMTCSNCMCNWEKNGLWGIFWNKIPYEPWFCIHQKNSKSKT